MNPDATESFPASSAQQRLWFLQQRHPESRAYTVTEAVWLRGPLDTDALEGALAALTVRHDQLRAVFEYRDGTLLQRIVPPAEQPFRLGRRTVAREDLDRWFADETAVPFDLARGPVYRATLLDTGGDERVLALCLPHLVTDGWSAGLFFAELATAYRYLADGGTPAGTARPATTGRPSRTNGGGWRHPPSTTGSTRPRPRCPAPRSRWTCRSTRRPPTPPRPASGASASPTTWSDASRRTRPTRAPPPSWCTRPPTRSCSPAGPARTNWSTGHPRPAGTATPRPPPTGCS